MNTLLIKHKEKTAKVAGIARKLSEMGNGEIMGGWKNILYTVLTIALVVRILAALVGLENYRYANSRGLCAEFKVTDRVARVLKDECLNDTMDISMAPWLLYKAIF
jgi:hypothetical protein